MYELIGNGQNVFDVKEEKLIQKIIKLSFYFLVKIKQVTMPQLKYRLTHPFPLFCFFGNPAYNVK